MLPNELKKTWNQLGTLGDGNRIERQDREGDGGEVATELTRQKRMQESRGTRHNIRCNGSKVLTRNVGPERRWH